MITRTFITVFALAILTTFSNIPKLSFELTFLKKNFISTEKKKVKTPREVVFIIKLWPKPEKVEFSENRKKYYIIGTATSEGKTRYIIQKKSSGRGKFEGKGGVIYIQELYIAEIKIKGLTYRDITLCGKLERKKEK